MKKAKDGAARRLRIASCLCLLFMIVEFVGKIFRSLSRLSNIEEGKKVFNARRHVYAKWSGEVSFQGRAKIGFSESFRV